MNRIWSAALCALLAGCATCREHPAACKVATVLVVGAVATAAFAHDGDGRKRSGRCGGQPLLCRTR